jgi:acetyltransferase-like isoleucine patch superfamily enzyme
VRRSLPLPDELFDRWTRAENHGLGEGTASHPRSHVYGDVKLGADAWIGPKALLDGSGGLTIGSWCAISAGVHTHNTVDRAVTGGMAEYRRAGLYRRPKPSAPLLSVVATGLSVGSRSVVGAQTYVNRDVADESIVVGAQGRVVGRVELSDHDGLRYVYEERT